MPRLLIAFVIVFQFALNTASASQFPVVGFGAKRLVLFDSVTIDQVQKVMASQEPDSAKRQTLISLFVVVGTPIGDGGSYCEVVQREYSTAQLNDRTERCLSILQSDDFLYNLVDDPAEDFSADELNSALANMFKLFYLM